MDRMPNFGGTGKDTKQPLPEDLEAVLKEVNAAEASGRGRMPGTIDTTDEDEKLVDEFRKKADGGSMH